MSEKSFHTVEEIAQKTYRINEADTVNCYLLLGEERALLIDTGNGMGSIRSVAESLTDLPLDVVLTHAHCDHIGGATQFEKIHLHHADMAFIYKITSSMSVSRRLISGSPQLSEMGITKKNLKKGPYRPERIPIQNGHIFDLGNRTVKAVNTPGHTRGSLVFVDDREKLMFTGDNVCPALWLFVPGATSIERWTEGAWTILELSRTYTPYCGHGSGPQTSGQIEQLLHLAGEVMKTYPRDSFFTRMKIYPSKEMAIQESTVTLWFRTGNIYGR